MTDDGIRARRQPFTACCVDSALIPSQTLSLHYTIGDIGVNKTVASREPAVVVDPTQGI